MFSKYILDPLVYPLVTYGKDNSHTLRSYVFKTEKKHTASHWIRNRSALSTLSLFSRPAIYELFLFSSVSHVFLILLPNLISLFSYTACARVRQIWGEDGQESLICLSLNNQGIRLVIEIADLLIKGFHFGKTVRGFENNFMWFLIHFGNHFYMSISYQFMLRMMFIKSEKDVS